MVQPLAPKDFVTLEERTIDDMWEVAALIEVLEKKGVGSLMVGGYPERNESPAVYQLHFRMKGPELVAVRGSWLSIYSASLGAAFLCFSASVWEPS